jgi:hypothetical protein
MILSETGAHFAGSCVALSCVRPFTRSGGDDAGSLTANLLSVFPEKLAAQLFAMPSRKLAADELLFLAGDPGDGCYRVEQGLLKVSMIAPSGAERILAIVGRAPSSASFRPSTACRARRRSRPSAIPN